MVNISNKIIKFNMIKNFKQFVTEELKNNNLEDYKKIVNTNLMKDETKKDTDKQLIDVNNIKNNIEKLKKEMIEKKNLVEKYQTDATLNNPQNKKQVEDMLLKYENDIKFLDKTIKDFETQLTAIKTTNNI